MGNELASVRRKAMDLLNNKLQHRTQWDAEQVTQQVHSRANLHMPVITLCLQYDTMRLTSCLFSGNGAPPADRRPAEHRG